MPAATLAHDAPDLRPGDGAPRLPRRGAGVRPGDARRIPTGAEALDETLLRLLASPNICSRRWIWEQYDHQVMLNTVVLPGSDAAVLRIGDTGRGEMTNRAHRGLERLQRPLLLPRPVRGRADRVRRGGAQRRVRRRRARGDHRLPQLRQPREARGLLDVPRGRPRPGRRVQAPSACRSSRGNVSFYNESFGQPIYPTPTVGLVGLLDDVDAALHDGVQGRGRRDRARRRDARTSSAAASTSRSCTASSPAARPRSTSSSSAPCRRPLREAIARGLVQAARTTAPRAASPSRSPSAASRAASAPTSTSTTTCAPVASLFSETQGRIVVTCAEADVEALVDLPRAHDVPYAVIGDGRRRASARSRAWSTSPLERPARGLRADARAARARRRAAADRGAVARARRPRRSGDGVPRRSHGYL